MSHIRLTSLYAIIAVLLAPLSVGAQQLDPNTPNLLPQSAAPAAPAQQQGVQPAIVPGATIEPGDQLSVQVYGDPSLSQSVGVAADGSIDYPLIGRVAVVGLTPVDASTLITNKLMKYVKHPLVTVAVTQVGEEGVLVLGNVKTPGKYAIRSGGHVTDALAAAGGLGPTDGDLPDARITNSDGTVQDISLQKLLHDGDSALNVPVTNNSIVYVVAPNAITVEVVGAVDRPGAVQIDEGDRLSMAIARAGTSPNMNSDLNHVVITRYGLDGKATKQEVNMYNALKGGDRRYDPVLAKGDVVYVPQGRKPSNLILDPFSLLTTLIGL